jgi:hypothetical protein
MQFRPAVGSTEVRDRDESDDDRDDPQDIDLDWAESQEDDGEDTRHCPNCGYEIYWSAAKCPRCGAWVGEDSPAAERARGWKWPVIVSVLVAIILVIWVGLR